jgi:GNAT superfamily N-acetyltransferase
VLPPPGTGSGCGGCTSGAGPRPVTARFIAPFPQLPEAYLDAVLSGDPRVVALVAADPERPCRLVALGSAHLSPLQAADIGLLVEDGWQRRGVGTMMLRRLAGLARERGAASLTATYLGAHRWIPRTLRSVLGSVRCGPASTCVEVSVPL